MIVLLKITYMIREIDCRTFKDRARTCARAISFWNDHKWGKSWILTFFYNFLMTFFYIFCFKNPFFQNSCITLIPSTIINFGDMKKCPTMFLFHFWYWFRISNFQARARTCARAKIQCNIVKNAKFWIFAS